MSIRIAKGPPTEEGNYLGLIQDDYWFPFRVEALSCLDGIHRLHAWATDGPDDTGWVPIEQMDIISKWSTRIPDPEETASEGQET
jgi:hypothetical protein